MKKKHLIEALKDFDDEDNIILGGEAYSFVPEITVVCGKGQEYMSYFCVRKKGHEGKCFCRCKNVDFIPD